MLFSEIRELRGRPPVLTMEAEQSVEDAIKMMCDNQTDSIVVMRDGHMAGIVTERDLLQKVLGSRHDAELLSLEDIMTRDVEVAHLQDELSEGLEKMERGHFRHLPVVDDAGHVVTVMTQGDFVARNAADTLHLIKETTPKKFYEGFQPWLMLVGIITYFMITTAVIWAYFGIL